MHSDERHSDPGRSRMPLGDGFTAGLDDLSAAEMLALVLGELRRLRDALGEQADELSRLREAVRRPERVRYYEEDLERRLGISRSTIYRLWREGLLDFHQDRIPNKRGLGRRYCTELDVERYERRGVHS